MAQTRRAGVGLLAVVVFAVACQSLAQTSAPGGISLSTAVRVQSPGWWPTKGDASRDSYVGNGECAKCHAAKVQTQQTNAMAHAATRTADSQILHQHDRLDHRLGPYREEIVTQSGKRFDGYRSDQSESLSVDLLWAFGVGHIGQTYVYQKNETFYEGHLSFYISLQDLDVTPGQSSATPGSLEEAAGRRMTPGETRRCFGCHTTASVTKNQFDPNSAVLGVTCEACHGPGASHAAAMRAGLQEQGKELIVNPSRLNPIDSVDFCGACHRTWQDVVAVGFAGIGVYNVRFAPYRLEDSRCWGKGDARLTCMACHDPHQPLQHDAAAYDSRCLQCHVNQAGSKTTASHRGAACRVSTKNCTSCHMPKIETPAQHTTFTDHRIRIVRPGEPYPT